MPKFDAEAFKARRSMSPIDQVDIDALCDRISDWMRQEDENAKLILMVMEQSQEFNTIMSKPRGELTEANLERISSFEGDAVIALLARAIATMAALI